MGDWVCGYCDRPEGTAHKDGCPYFNAAPPATAASLNPNPSEAGAGSAVAAPTNCPHCGAMLGHWFNCPTLARSERTVVTDAMVHGALEAAQKALHPTYIIDARRPWHESELLAVRKMLEAAIGVQRFDKIVDAAKSAADSRADKEDNSNMFRAWRQQESEERATNNQSEMTEASSLALARFLLKNLGGYSGDKDGFFGDENYLARMLQGQWQQAQEAALARSSSANVKYERRPELDKRFSCGDDFAGDAWVRWTAVGRSPNEDSSSATSGGKSS